MTLRLVVTVGLVAAAVETGSAQWINYPDPGIPRTADGKPNLTAPAQRTRDGKIDLGGLWNNPDGRFLTDLAKRANITVPLSIVPLPFGRPTSSGVGCASMRAWRAGSSSTG